MKLAPTVLLALAFIIPSISTIVRADDQPTATKGSAKAIQDVTINGKIVNLQETGLTSKDSVRLQRMIKEGVTSRSEDIGVRTRIKVDGTFSLHAKALLPAEYLISTTGMCLLSMSTDSLTKVIIKPDATSPSVIQLGNLVVTGAQKPCRK